MTGIRRIVTAHDDQGRSIVQFDDGGTNRLDSQSFPGLVMHELWARIERHRTMHRTLTLDYLVVLSGEMWMLLDDGEVLLTPGTCVIQQATAHGFSNRSSDYCVFAAVLIEARP